MNCRATCVGAATVSASRSRPTGVLALVLVLCSSATLAQPQAELQDTVARLQYAFYTADARELQNVLNLLEQYDMPASAEALHAYYVAYGYWKLAQLHAEQPPQRSAASRAAKSCGMHARAAVEADSRLAEAWALEAICDELPHATMRLASLQKAACARHRSLRAALSIAPENPRVQLIEKMCSAQASDPATLAPQRWQAVVDAFANEAPSASGRPDWGHAEALTLLGEIHLQNGNTVAARDAIERALVLAPDYLAARNALESVTRVR